MSTRQLYDFTLEVVATTTAALLITDGAGITEWLPKSRIACIEHLEIDEIDEGDIVTLQIEEWLAKEKGLM